MNDQQIASLKEYRSDAWTKDLTLCRQKIDDVISNPCHDTILRLKEYLENVDNEKAQGLIDLSKELLAGMPKPEVVLPALANSRSVVTAVPATAKTEAIVTDMIAQAKVQTDKAMQVSADGIFEIDPTAEIKLHPYAELKPMPTQKEFERYVSSIKDFGQTAPVEFFNGQLINGLCQVNACQKLGITIKAINWTGSEDELFLHVFGAENPIKFTAGQKAAYAVNLLPELESKALERKARPEKFSWSEKGEAREIAARLTGSNKKSVSDMKKIKAERPELFKEVAAGKKTVNKVMLEAKFREGNKNSSIADELRAALSRLPDTDAEWFRDKATQSGPAAKIYQERLNNITHQLLDHQIESMREAS